ncbi:MAG TPA: M20/M25/M40 family metallo-hydrolase [Terriglobia bacterium]|nr:M20/M25/M40 family metallo-hydrolase [Terriglobia bacterium]
MFKRLAVKLRANLSVIAVCSTLAAALATNVSAVAAGDARRQDSSAGKLAEAEVAAVNWPAYQDETVRLLQEYLRIDTSNPPGNEIHAAEFFKKLFDDAGIASTIYPYAPGRADIYAVLKGDGSLRPIVLLSHMDVVRADPRNWKVPPFAGQILDGELYGRGAEDMKDQGLLNAMMLLIASREHLQLKRDLIFLATADEEVNDTGSQWIIDHHPELVRGAEYLITEGGSNLIFPARGTIYGIDVAEKAPFWLRLTATGAGGHGSIPIADSATNRLVRALNRVVNWETPVRLLPSVEQYFHQIAATEPEPLASEYRDIRHSVEDPAVVKQISSDPDLNYRIRDTISLTVLRGSQQTNVIPDEASADLDIRLLPGEDPQEFLGRLRAVVNDDRIRLTSIDTFRRPNSSSTDTALYRIIEGVVHEYSPQALVTPVLDSGYTENQMYRPLGITCYGFLPVELTPEVEATEHAANERIPVDQLRRGLKMFYEVIARAAIQ